MQSVPPSPGHWKPLQGDRQYRRRLQPSPMPQAAIKRMASEEPGPGQMYATQARKHIATLRRAGLDITIEIRWCPAHKGVPGNEKADEWAKLAAEEPDSRGGGMDAVFGSVQVVAGWNGGQ